MDFRFFKPRVGAPHPPSNANSAHGAAQSAANQTEQGISESQDAKRRVVPIHPIFFAAFPILALFVYNLGQVPLWQLLRPLSLTLLTTFVIWALFWLVTRQARKAAIAASAIVSTFFAYGHIVNLLPSGLRMLAAPVCLLALIALLVAISKTRRPLFDTTSILNVMSVVLIASPLWTIGAQVWYGSLLTAPVGSHTEDILRALPPPAPTAVSPPRHLVPASPDLPDIYYIILDAYGRADRLKQFYGYDNTDFVRALEKRGFYIPPHSHANYDQTPLCLSSALSMNYLDYPAAQMSPEFLRQLVDDSAVAGVLRKYGYRYVSIWSGLDVSRVTTADAVFNNKADLSHFEGKTIGLTPLGQQATVQHDGYEGHRDRSRGVFDNLDTAARLPAPKFVFAHVLAPHPPFVFGPNGESVDPNGPLILDDASWLLKKITKEEYKRGYIAQLRYVNKRVIHAVDAILRQSRRPPIIIIQGDHGSRMSLDWESLANTDLREPFSILNAYHVPPKMRGALYDTITPVNSFRVLLSSLFHEKYALLPDRSFYSGTDHPYEFTDVTSSLHE